MADEASTDMFMRFFTTASKAVPAECPLNISPNDSIALKDQLSKGFDEGNTGDYFLVSRFSFGAELRDTEAQAGKGTQPGAHGQPQTFTINQSGARGGTAGHGGHGASPAGGQGGHMTVTANAPKQTGSGFARWRSATDDSWSKDKAYPAYVSEFSFTRLIDLATPTLFDYCTKKKTFPFVTFIKRKSAVARKHADLETGLWHEELCYLRIDLADVLITGISWSDGDIVEETCKIKCQKMRVIYAQQMHNSTLVSKAPVDWKSPVATTQS